MVNEITSGLPLLLVKGQFTSLTQMTVEEYETFIPFLVKCSVNRAGAKFKNRIPEWWSQNVPYKFPLRKPKGLSEKGWSMHLRKLITRCYYYHNAQYLLSFCDLVSKKREVFREEVNNDKKTTSVYVARQAQPVLTFNNENKYYDAAAKFRPQRPTRMCLLPVSPKKSVIITDVFLCENCDAEFSSQKDMQTHEEECFGSTQNDTSQEYKQMGSKESLPDGTNKIHFLQSMGLSHSSDTPQLPKRKLICDTPAKRWISANMCLSKNGNIEFSSSLGKQMWAFRQKREDKSDRTILKYEYFCSPDVRMCNRVKQVKTVYKKPKVQCSRTYSFNKYQRMNRCLSIMTGLDAKSRYLQAKCKDVIIRLTRLDQKTMDSYSKPKVIKRILQEKQTKAASNTSAPVTIPDTGVTDLINCKPDKYPSPEVEVQSRLQVILYEGVSKIRICNGTKDAARNIAVIDLCSSDEES